MAMRAAMHRAGATALSQLLRTDPPGLDKREIACPCGQKARYREMRSRRVLTAVGEVELLRPWYLCRKCHHGQCPSDDPDSTTYVAAIESAREFGPRLYLEACCATRTTARNTSLSAQASSKPAARRSSVPAASNPACSGPSVAPMPSSPSAAASSTDASRITGKHAKRLEFHSHVAHPWLQPSFRRLTAGNHASACIA